MLDPMKWTTPLLILALASPAAAQESEDAPSLMERGAQMFLEGLMQEVEPRLDDLQDLSKEFGPALRGFFEEMGPALGGLLEQVEDWSAYEPPEILPNGDIIIRRKPQQAPDDLDPDAEGPVDEPIEL